MKHDTEIFDGEPFNFEKILGHYLKFTNQASSSVGTIHRPVIMKAFEHIKVNYFKSFFSFF